MLDIRVYRAAFLPALIALFVAAFSLEDRPAPSLSPLEADAFAGERAFGQGDLRNSLSELGRSFPTRSPGSSDDHALADRVARTLAARDQSGRPAFRVSRERAGEVETVVGVRPGLSSRGIVVLSRRDARANTPPPALAELSGTAAMLELARLFRARDLRKTLVLVSTSGATDGFTGARAWAEGAAESTIEAVLGLGDMGGGRRALPATVSEQGVIAATGLPAMMISASGERGPAPGAEVSPERLDEFGRAALRAVTAIDAAQPEHDELASPAFTGGPNGIITMRNVLPDWAVRLLVGTLLLPALLTALDGFFRVRRRKLRLGPWFGWLAAAGLPLLLAWLWLRLLGLVGALDVPAAPVLPPPPFDWQGAVAAGSVALVLALGWFGVRPLLLERFGVRGSPGAGRLAATTGAVLCVLAALVWVVNPYAAALLLPAAHLWVFAAAPQTRLRGWAGVAALAAGLLPFALAVLYYGQALRLAPHELAWSALLGAASGALPIALAVSAAVVGACFAGLVLVMRT